MTKNDSHLTGLYAGKRVDTQLMEQESWYDQGSANFHFGLKMAKNLWLKKFDPAEKCCHTVWLFVMMQLGSNNVIKSISSDVHQVFNDGSFESLGVPFFPHDYEMVKNHMKGIIVDETEQKSATSIPLNMQKFIDLLGKGITSLPVKKLAKTYSMRESLRYAVLDAGRFLISDDQRIEIHFDQLHQVSTIFLKSITKNDVLLDGITASSTRKEIRKKLGSPTTSAEDGWWDRYDNEVYKLHFQYSNNKISKITIMSPTAAP